MGNARFSCESCGKSYAWKPEFAGKKVKCGCGAVMTAPAEPPAAPEEDLYDLADDPRPPRKPVVDAPAPASAIAPAPAARATPGAATTAPRASAPVSPLLAYQQGSRFRDDDQEKSKNRSDFENQLGGELWRELYLPGAMVIVGLGLNMLLFMQTAGGWVSPRTIITPLLLTLAFNLVLSFIGVIIVARLFEIGFGHPGTAILKLSACVLLPTAIAGFAGNWMGSDSFFVNFMVRATLMFPLTLACVMLFFQLALDESIWVVCVIYLITDWVTKFILAAMLTTGVGAGLGGAFFGIADMETAEDVSQSRSPEIEKMVKSGDALDAAKWLSQGDRTFGPNVVPNTAKFTPDRAMQLLQTIKAAGATDIRVGDLWSFRAYELYIGIPKDEDAREKLIETCEGLAEQLGLGLDEVLDDDTYLILNFPEGSEDSTIPIKPDGTYR